MENIRKQYAPFIHYFILQWGEEPNPRAGALLCLICTCDRTEMLGNRVCVGVHLIHLTLCEYIHIGKRFLLALATITPTWLPSILGESPICTEIGSLGSFVQSAAVLSQRLDTWRLHGCGNGCRWMGNERFRFGHIQYWFFGIPSIAASFTQINRRSSSWPRSVRTQIRLYQILIGIQLAVVEAVGAHAFAYYIGECQSEFFGK